MSSKDVFRLNAQQEKQRDRVLAWLRNQPFAEKRNGLGAVPQLTREEVLEQYIPLGKRLGQFFTPTTFAEEVFLRVNWGQWSRPCDVLEPAAGIGRLVYPLAKFQGEAGHRVTCIELANDEHDLGQRLFPQFDWSYRCPFARWEQLAARFDVILSNPPFGVWLDTDMLTRCQWAKKSEQCWLELAAHALRPGGVAVVIAPDDFLDNLPVQGQDWLWGGKHLAYEWQLPTAEKFLFTNIKAVAFAFRRPVSMN
jgi:SAM-dependent methyltransferase